MIAYILHLFLTASLFTSPLTFDKKEIYAFVNVTVIPMTGETVLENQTVVIRGDRIVAIGPSSEVEVSQDAVRIDGNGRYLIPGLAEMHGHIPPPTQSAQEIENVLFLYVANGITTVRGMLGYANQMELKKKALAGEIVSPNLYLAGPSFNGNSIRSPEQATEKARAQKAEGWDLIKIHPGLSRAEYDAMAETAHELEMRFGGHVPSDVGISHALDMGQETFDHLDGYLEYVADKNGYVDEDKLTEIVRKTKETGAWVVPTMVLWETILGASDLEKMRSYPELEYVSPHAVQGWVNAFRQRISSPQYDPVISSNVAKSRIHILASLHKAGVPVLMGTDAPQQFSVPGFSLHRELERMLDADMSPYEILKSGTYNVGLYFKDQDNFGTIEVGQRADLLLLNRNPLDDVRNVSARAGVMVRGTWISDDDIRDRLKEIARSYSS